jgi:hypothetical protein
LVAIAATAFIDTEEGDFGRLFLFCPSARMAFENCRVFPGGISSFVEACKRGRLTVAPQCPSRLTAHGLSVIEHFDSFADLDPEGGTCGWPLDYDPQRKFGVDLRLFTE